MQTGKSECSVRADYLMADFTGCMPDALIREMRTEHICGRWDVGHHESWYHICGCVCDELVQCVSSLSLLLKLGNHCP